MKKNKQSNIAQLARALGWQVHGREYKHLLILLNYMSLNKALTLVLNNEVNLDYQDKGEV